MRSGRSVRRSSIPTIAAFGGTRPTLQKEPGQFRIVCVGDSVTFGYNATTDKKAYPAVLQQLFDEHSEAIEVINAGMPGFESRHVAAFVEKVILGIGGDEIEPPLEPNLVLVECGWNDARRFAPEPEPTYPTLWNRVAGTFYVVRLPARFLLAARTGDPTWQERAEWSLIEKVRRGPAQHYPKAEKRYRRWIDKTVELCHENNVRIALIAPPNFLETDLDDAAWRKCASHFAAYATLSFQGWQTMVESMIEANRTVAGEREAAFIDTTSLSDATLFADICHLNDAGNERLAQLVYRELLRQDLVPVDGTEP